MLVKSTQKEKQTLDLYGKGLEHVPKILIYIATKGIIATILDLSNNKIIKIKEGAFGNLVHLKKLSAGHQGRRVGRSLVIASSSHHRHYLDQCHAKRIYPPQKFAVVSVEFD